MNSEFGVGVIMKNLFYGGMKLKILLLRSKNDDDDDDEDDEDDDDEDFECVVKGKSTSLSQFYRVARNLVTMVFKQPEPDPREVEEEYWRLVIERDAHVQVG